MQTTVPHLLLHYLSSCFPASSLSACRLDVTCSIRISFPWHYISVPIPFLCSIYNKNPWKIFKVYISPIFAYWTDSNKTLSSQSTKTALSRLPASSVLLSLMVDSQSCLTCHHLTLSNHTSSLQHFFRLAPGTPSSAGFPGMPLWFLVSAGDCLLIPPIPQMLGCLLLSSL